MSEQRLNFDGKEYDIASLSDGVRSVINQISVCDEQIQQLSNEWAIADTARMAYLAALERELSK